jgi:hypothetical protein
MLLTMTAVTFAATSASTVPPQEPSTAEQQQWASAIQEFIDRMLTDTIYQRDKALLQSYERDKAKCAASFTSDACTQRRKVIL